MKNKLLIISLLINALVLVGLAYYVQRSGGLSYFLFRLNHGGQVGMSVGRQSQFDLLPARPGSIVMLGDSLTQDGEWREWLDNPQLINRGVVGRRSDTLLHHLASVTRLQPEKIFLMSGINDVLGASPAQAAATLKAILEQIRADSPQTRLYLQSVLPVNNDLRNTGRRNADVLALNALLQPLCQRARCVWIDLHSEFADSNGDLRRNYSTDGVHLNGTGYQRWAELLKPYLEDSGAP